MLSSPLPPILPFFFFLSRLSLPLPFYSPMQLLRILVEKLAAPTKTVGGVLLPESATAGKVRV